MKDFNLFAFVGNLVKDPELKTSVTGIIFCIMIVAVNSDQDKPADFFRVSAFGKSAEACSKYLCKGARVLVEGSIHNNNYEKPDGTKVYSMSVTAKNVHFLSYGNTAQNTSSSPYPTTSAPAGSTPSALPFPNYPSAAQPQVTSIQQPAPYAAPVQGYPTPPQPYVPYQAASSAPAAPTTPPQQSVAYTAPQECPVTSEPVPLPPPPATSVIPPCGEYTDEQRQAMISKFLLGDHEDEGEEF